LNKRPEVVVSIERRIGVEIDVDSDIAEYLKGEKEETEE